MTIKNARKRAGVFLSQRKKGAFLNLMVNTVNGLGLGFASFYFQSQGLDFYKIMLVWAIGPLVSLPFVYFINSWNTKKFLRLGVLAYAGAALSLLFYSPYSYLLFGVFNGLMLGLFWVSFNNVFFNRSVDHQHAKDSSIYFIIPAIAGIIMPSLGALLIDNSGYKVLFAVTFLICILPFLYIQGKYFDYKETISFKQADKDFSGIRLIAFFDGALHFFQGHFLTIYALLFLQTEYEVGALLGYLALVSLSVSFALSYASDRYKKRVEILYPLLFAMAILIIAIPSVNSLAILIPIIGIYAVLDNLSLPIRFAVHLDMGTKDTGFWRVSEFYGNIGRSIIFAVAAVSLWLGNYWLPFAIFAGMTAIFPFIIKSKLRQQQDLRVQPLTP
jgi:MFS family permease